MMSLFRGNVRICNLLAIYITLYNDITEEIMKDFAGKILFITGGASGAGFGQAKVFSEAGCKIVIADIRQDHLDEAMEYFRDKKVEAHAIKLDITDRKAYAAAADEVEEVFGSPPQLLFNTAGVNAFGPAEASTFEDFDWVIGVNLFGVINAMVIFVPRMIKAGKGGHIVTTSSMGGFMAASGCTPYSVSKAAINSLMECYYNALKPYGIGVSIRISTRQRLQDQSI
jgi:NAD(P)-dependent dehydrogenase (short-subunit alcohol dehydrogenase family)